MSISDFYCLRWNQDYWLFGSCDTDWLLQSQNVRLYFPKSENPSPIGLFRELQIINSQDFLFFPASEILSTERPPFELRQFFLLANLFAEVA